MSGVGRACLGCPPSFLRAPLGARGGSWRPLGVTGFWEGSLVLEQEAKGHQLRVQRYASCGPDGAPNTLAAGLAARPTALIPPASSCCPVLWVEGSPPRTARPPEAWWVIRKSSLRPASAGVRSEPRALMTFGLLPGRLLGFGSEDSREQHNLPPCGLRAASGTNSSSKARGLRRRGSLMVQGAPVRIWAEPGRS